MVLIQTIVMDLVTTILHHNSVMHLETSATAVVTVVVSTMFGATHRNHDKVVDTDQPVAVTDMDHR